MTLPVIWNDACDLDFSADWPRIGRPRMIETDFGGSVKEPMDFASHCVERGGRVRRHDRLV